MTPVAIDHGHHPWRSIEPLIGRIEGRDRKIQEFQVADCPMPAARFDQDRRSGADLAQLPIEFHLPGTFEKIINFGHLPVVMRSGISISLYDMQRGDPIGVVGKGASRAAAGAGDRPDRVGLADAVSRLVFRHVRFGKGLLRFVHRGFVPCSFKKMVGRLAHRQKTAPPDYLIVPQFRLHEGSRQMRSGPTGSIAAGPFLQFAPAVFARFNLRLKFLKL